MRFCSDCFDNRALSFSTVPQVVVGIVTRAAAEAASICANLLVVYCRRDSSLPISTLKKGLPQEEFGLVFLDPAGLGIQDLQN